MTAVVPDTDALRTILKSQYHAALEMLGEAIEKCSHDLWTSDAYPNRFWQVAYHAVFFTHLYLQPDESHFRQWDMHREESQFLGSLPWPPYRAPKSGKPYTKAQVAEYLRVCDSMVDGALDRIDLQSPDSGFWWYRMSKLEHQMVNLRHVQHHVAQLLDRLRTREGVGVHWVSGKPTGTGVD